MKKVSLFILFIFLSGCISRANYPINWVKPESVTPSSCLNWSGTFNNHGENTSKNGENILSAIFAVPTVSTHDADTVKLHTDTGKGLINVEIYKKGEIITHLSLEQVKNEFVCEDGKITIKRNTFLNDGGAIGKEWVSYTLNLTAEALIIEKKNGVAGALFFIPIVGQESNWLRFKKV